MELVSDEDLEREAVPEADRELVSVSVGDTVSDCDRDADLDTDNDDVVVSDEDGEVVSDREIEREVEGVLVVESERVDDVVCSSESETESVDVPVNVLLALLLCELETVRLAVKESVMLEDNVNESECVPEKEALNVTDRDLDGDEV